MAESLVTIPLRVGLVTFICGWMLGFALRLNFRGSTSNLIDPSRVPAYRQINVAGTFRWLFGYRPIRGPVSVAGFVIQFPALLALVTSIIVAVLWPTQHSLALAPLAVFFCVMPVCARIADRVWRDQQQDLTVHSSDR
jgi:hypothetical protein